MQKVTVPATVSVPMPVSLMLYLFDCTKTNGTNPQFDSQ